MENNSTKIDAYLDGKLSKEEKAAFEADMNANPSLQEEVSDYKLERLAIQEILRNSYKEELKSMVDTEDINLIWENTTEDTLDEEKDISQEAKVVAIRPIRRILSIAASALLLIAAGTTWWANSNYSNKDILDEGYTVAVSPGNKSDNQSTNPIFEGGLQTFFINKDYTQAIQQFEAIKDNDSDYIAAQYYLAHSYLNLQEYDTAISKFETVLNTPNTPTFIDLNEVSWNQLLAYLGNNDQGPIFQQKLKDLMATNAPVYQNKAENLNNQLNSIWRKFVF